MLHSVGLALGDINLGNFAKLNGKVVFLDPSAIGEIGKPQDVATDIFGQNSSGELLYLLSEHDRALLEDGGLLLDHNRDVAIIRRIHEIMVALLYEQGLEATDAGPLQTSRFDPYLQGGDIDFAEAEELQRERAKDMRSRRARRRKEEKGGAGRYLRGLIEDIKG